MPNAAAAPTLTGWQIRKLRAMGHALKPVVAVGKEGVTDAVVRAIASALGTHELVKVKLQSEAPVERREAAAQLAQATGAVLAQVLGRTVLLYKRHPKKPKIDLTKPRATAASKKAAAKPKVGERRPKLDAADDDGDVDG
jgi:RNA-binding protein